VGQNIFKKHAQPAYKREVIPSSPFRETNKGNCRRKAGSKFLADAGFIIDKTPVTTVMQREEIKILMGCSVDQQTRKLRKS